MWQRVQRSFLISSYNTCCCSLLIAFPLTIVLVSGRLRVAGKLTGLSCAGRRSLAGRSCPGRRSCLPFPGGVFLRSSLFLGSYGFGLWSCLGLSFTRLIKSVMGDLVPRNGGGWVQASIFILSVAKVHRALPWESASIRSSPSVGIENVLHSSGLRRPRASSR